MTAPILSQPDVRPVLSVTEAADLLGVSPWLVLQQISRGNLPHKRFGRRILIPRARFEAWLDEQTNSRTTDGSQPSTWPTGACAMASATNQLHAAVPLRSVAKLRRVPPSNRVDT